MTEYPHIATERFNSAKIWIKYVINIKQDLKFGEEI